MVSIRSGGIFLPVFCKDPSLAFFSFVIFINDLSDSLQCNPKLFADDISFFATEHNINKARNDLSNDLSNDLTKFMKSDF